MKFKDIAFKSFKRNMKKYLVYYLCNSFIVASFFMYSVLIFNERLWKSSQIENGVLQTLVIPNAALGVFSLFFISYTHSSFVKWRKREFGILMNLGMTIGDIRKIIFYENTIVAFGSVLLGILTGLVFSRLFFIVITRLLGVSGVSYVIGYKNFVFSIIVFSGIYLANLLATLITTCRFEVIKLLKADRRILNNRFSNPVLAIIGLAMVIGSFTILYIKFKVQDNTNIFLEAAIVIFIGVYIFISQLGGFLLKQIKKRKKIYYNRLLLITSLNSKYRQTKKIIFIISILTTVVIFYIGAMLSFYMTSEKYAVNYNTYDLSYAEFGDKNIMTQKRLNDIVLKNNEKITRHESAEFIIYYETGKHPNRKIIMKDKEINRLGRMNLNIKRGNYIYLNQFEKGSQDEKKDLKAFNLKLKFNNEIYELCNQEIVFKAVFFSSNYIYSEIMVLNEDDYNFIKEQKECCKVGRFQLYNFNNWKNTKSIVDELTNELFTSNKNAKPFNSKVLNDMKDKLLQVTSRIGYYTSEKQGTILILTTSAYLGIFFFIAAAIVLFLKLLSDIDADKTRFASMYKIGFTDDEIRNQIGQELKPVFFIGPVIGIILAFAYTITFSQDGLEGVRRYFIYSDIIVSTVFLIIQILYYFICKRIYCNELLEEF